MQCLLLRTRHHRRNNRGIFASRSSLSLRCLSWISDTQEHVDVAPALVTTAHLHSPTVKGHHYGVHPPPFAPNTTRRSGKFLSQSSTFSYSCFIESRAHSQATWPFWKPRHALARRAFGRRQESAKRQSSLPDLEGEAYHTTQHGDRQWVKAKRYDEGASPQNPIPR